MFGSFSSDVSNNLTISLYLSLSIDLLSLTYRINKPFFFLNVAIKYFTILIKYSLTSLVEI